jgi:hypothetical protein
MCRISVSVISFVLLLSMAGSATAAYDQYSGPANGNYNTAGNWALGYVPTTADKAGFKTAGGPLVNSSTPTCDQWTLGGTSGGIITIASGGSVQTNGRVSFGQSAGENGTLVMTGGTAAFGANVDLGYAGSGTIDMSGGTITIATTLSIATGTSGDIYLDGGTIACNALSMTSKGAIDITAGTLIINGDARTTVNGYVSNGWITGYNGSGTVNVNYSGGQTIVTASSGSSPPGQAANPSPSNSATGVSTTADLSWSAGSGATSHDVYFGTSSPGAYQGNQTGTTFDTGTMANSTTYYWRIDEKNAYGTTTGTVWSFTTSAGGSPPGQASSPSPANSATNVSITADLSWTAGSGATSHDVYFGTSSPGTFRGNQTSTTYDTGTMSNNTTYYWRIDEKNASGTTTGSVWSFTTTSAVQANVRKGPYLIYPGNNTQMTVLWQLDAAAGCSIAWGVDTNYSTGSANTSEYGSDHQHKYNITGLTPGVKYYYRVTIGSNNYTGNFYAAPADDAASVKFLMYGDTRTHINSNNTVCGRMITAYTNDPACQTMVLHAGDWVSSDSESTWTSEWYNYSYSYLATVTANTPFMGCIGNHETTGTGISVWLKYHPYNFYTPGRCYYSFDYGPVHVAVIDQYTTYSSGTQYNWLVSDLSNSSKPYKFIVLHEPAWTADGSHGNNSTVQTYIQPLCEDNGVQVVLGGHNHYYARAVRNGVHHLTSGGGGADLYDPSQQDYIVTYTKALNYQKVVISGDTGTVTSYDSSGNVIDEFPIYSSAPQPPGQAANPNPANSATNVSITTDLSWSAGAGATSHDVYFGTDSTPDSGEFQGNQSGTTFAPGTLSYSTTYYWRIDEKNDSGTTTGTVWSFTTAAAPPPPGQATNPNPANSATNVSITTDLSWTAGSGATSHDVYFGTTSPGTFQGNQAGTTFDTGTMANGTTYYWRIDEKNSSGTTTGTVWSFTTAAAGSPPGQASSPSPATSATNVSITTDLSWTAGSGATSHDVYFGTSSPGTFRGNQASATFDPGTLANSTTYYWRIDEKNAYGTTTGTVWSFTTAAAPGGLPWSDNFESGGFTSGGWSTSGSTTVTTAAKHAGTYGAKIAGVAWIEKAQSTVGYTSIHIQYWRTTNGYESNEPFICEWWNGSSWVGVDSSRSKVWTQMDITCASGANNNANFKVRFRSQGNDASTEYTYIDDVQITGTAQ